MTLGETILKLRKASGLSQEQLAEMLGVSRQAVSKWETDQSLPDIDKILLLSQTFSITTDELLGRDMVPAATPSGTSHLTEALAANARKRMLTLGWVTALIGLVLLAAEFFSLKLIQLSEMRADLEFHSGTGFFSDAMAYASKEPMPTIFTITAIIVLLGIALIALSLVRKRR